MSIPVTAIDTDSLVLHAAVLAELAKTARDAASEYRRELDRRMPPGSKLTAFDPRSEETVTLGTVNRSNPDPIPVVADRKAFERWCLRTYADQVEQWLEFGPPEEVGAVLAEHAPHLVTVHQSLPPEIAEQALKRAETEQIPGTKRQAAVPQLTVRTTAQAREVVRELLASSPFLRELEA